jgi:predicted Zn-dependent protease
MATSSLHHAAHYLNKDMGTVSCLSAVSSAEQILMSSSGRLIIVEVPTLRDIQLSNYICSICFNIIGHCQASSTIIVYLTVVTTHW